MSTKLMKALFEVKQYGIGDLNTKWAKHVTNGARLKTADADNYTIVEITGYNADGEQECQQLSAKANAGFLLTTIEEEQLTNLVLGIQETYTDFFNAVGEMVRLTRLETGVRFDTSSFSLNAGNSAVAKENVAHFDVATKKFIVSLKATPHADYAGSANKFKVVNEDTDFGSGFGIQTIRLECI